MTPSVATICSVFEHQTIQPYTGEPDYEAIKSVHDQLKANAASIPSELGGGKHGLLGLIMSDATYLLMANSSFRFPPNPGLLPTIPTGSTAQRLPTPTKRYVSIRSTSQRTGKCTTQIVL